MEFIVQEHSYLFVPTYISSKYLCYDDKDNEEKLVQFEAAPLLQKEFQPIVRCMKNPSLQKQLCILILKSQDILKILFYTFKNLLEFFLSLHRTKVEK